VDMHERTIEDFAVPAGMCALMLSFLVFTQWNKVRKSAKLEKWAEAHGLQYLGADLPREFPFNALEDEIGSWGEALNAIGGQRGSDFVLTFDIERGYGRNTYLQTVIARRSRALQPLKPLHENLRLICDDEWRIVIVQRPNLFLPFGCRMRIANVQEVWDLLA